MPRKRKTQSGAPAQPVGPVAGQTYGMGVEQMELQRQLPAPDNREAATPAAPSSMPTGPVGMPTAAAPSIGELLALAQGQGQGAGLLRQPSARPNEPITAGLPVGPGAGPAALGYTGTTPFGRTLRRLSEVIGDPTFAELAARTGN